MPRYKRHMPVVATRTHSTPGFFDGRLKNALLRALVESKGECLQAIVSELISDPKLRRSGALYLMPQTNCRQRNAGGSRPSMLNKLTWHIGWTNSRGYRKRPISMVSSRRDVERRTDDDRNLDQTHANFLRIDPRSISISARVERTNSLLQSSPYGSSGRLLM